MGATPEPFDLLAPGMGGDVPPGDELDVRLDCCASNKLKAGFWLEEGDELLLARASCAPPAPSLSARGGIWTLPSLFGACMPKGSKARGEAPRPGLEDWTRTSWLEVGLLLYRLEFSPYSARCWRAMSSRLSSSFMVLGLMERSDLPDPETSVLP
jgi:hypothetical protein